MKHPTKFSLSLLLMLLAAVSLTVPAFAISESEVAAQVAASSKEAVAGNVLIWFFCAVAFLKVSQKVDSFMSSLGINVGHTGGSLLSDAMIAVHAFTMATGKGRNAAGPSTSGSGASESTSPTGFFQGGLAGIVSRKVTSDAVRTATTQTSAVQSAQVKATASHAASEIRSDNAEHTSSDTRSDSVLQTEMSGQIPMWNALPTQIPMRQRPLYRESPLWAA